MKFNPLFRLALIFFASLAECTSTKTMSSGALHDSVAVREAEMGHEKCARQTVC
jgi:hypothetical protein